MKKRSMMVDLQKLARKYPSEVARLREAMKRGRQMAVVCRAIRKARGIETSSHAPATFDGTPGVPAWKAARRLGWRTSMVWVFARLYDIRCSSNRDGRMYFHPADVERVANAEKAKRRDGMPRLVPTAVSLREAAKVKGWSVRALKRTIRQRGIMTWLRGNEVRIPMCELERLEGPLHPPDLEA